MFLSLLIILSIGGLSFYCTDLRSDGVFDSVVLPIVDVFALVAKALWVVALFHRLGFKQSYGTGDAGDVSGGDFGGDGSF